MSLPTLLKPGSIVPQKWMTTEQKKALQTKKSIDWIIDYLLDRNWNKLSPPKIKIKGPGSRVGIFRSGTGTGKSTVFPPFIFNKFFEELNVKKNIICTQPTVATATDIPFQIAMYNKNLILGDTLGFQTGSLTFKPVKGVLFATIGILLQHLKMLTDEQFMKKYSFIILDEIHIRSVETDTTLFYLRRFLERNYDKPDCPYVILTSGTFEPGIFMDYFSCPKDAFLDIVGSSFPIEDHFTEFNLADTMTYAIDLCEKIHIENIIDVQENKLFRDILVFTQGGGQIADLVDRIHKLNAEVFSKGLEYAKKHSEEQQKKYKTGGKEKIPDQYYVCPVSVMSENMKKGSIDYQNLSADIDTVTVPIYRFTDGERTEEILQVVPASRRIIGATNAIETGMTIDTLKYCIDTGFVNESQFNPNFGVKALLNKSVTQASARQRRGRVGRKDPGHFFACYTKETYDALAPLPFPDIVKADITTMLLDIILNETETELVEVTSEMSNLGNKKYKSGTIDMQRAFQMNQFDQRWYALDIKNSIDISKLNFIQSPAADSLTYGLEKLRVLGFINTNLQPTILGWYGSKFRKVEIENVRMILAGYHHGANILDLITISCMIQSGHSLGIKKNKYKPRNPLGLSDIEAEQYYKMLFADEFIEYLFIWEDFMSCIDDFIPDIKKAVKSTSDKPNNKLLLIKRVEEWAEKNNFSADAFLNLIVMRGELIGDLLNIGISPFYNGLNLKPGSYSLVSILNDDLLMGMEEIRKIKKCIYEGYRLNLYIWNDITNSYVSAINHNQVTLDSKILKPIILDQDIKQARPQKIIVSGVMLRPSTSEPGMYEFLGADISVLDGFVDVDLEFLN